MLPLKLIFLAITVIVSTTLLFICSPCQATARLIRLPLRRTTTQNAGDHGQPVVNYYTVVQIGTPPKNFSIQFDLAAQEHFVPHYLWNPFYRNLHYSDGFQCKKSSTCSKDDRSVSINYQNCVLRGKRYEDIMSFAVSQYIDSTGAIATDKTINWIQSFLAISDASDSHFAKLPVDGYFGLSPAPQSLASLKNIISSLKDTNLIDNMQFALWLNPVLDDSNLGGELVLGGVDPNRFQGRIYWHSLASNHNYWMLKLSYVSFGSIIVSCVNEPNCRARFSSGVSDIYGPTQDVLNIYRIISTVADSSGLNTVDCGRINQLPIITFHIDGVPYALLPSNYIRKMADGRIFKSKTCYVAIFPSSENQEWTLGTNFLGAYYSVYDMTSMQMGIAALR